MRFIRHDYQILKSIDFSEYNSADIYFSYEWINYLKKSLNVTPFIIEIIDNDTIGYFVGANFKKFGLKIVGSPFRGWDTPYMGLLLKDECYSRTEIIKQLWLYCKKEFKCQYMEVCDRSISEQDIISNHLKYIVEKTYYMNIAKNDEELLSGFTKHCRKDLKLFVNRGATIQKVDYSQQFLDEFYVMLKNVFKVQNLTPPYSKEKLRILFESIKPDNMLCLEAYNPTGKCIGRSVSFGFLSNCYAFASATDRAENYNQKNYLRWKAIQYWRDSGKENYDLMGVRNYKLEFNPEEKKYYRIVFTKWKFLLPMRNIAQKMYWLFNKIKYKLKIKK